MLPLSSPKEAQIRKTASTIATSIVHSKLDYCNLSTYYNLPNTRQNPLIQHIQNSLARAVVRAPKSSHINPALKFLHWLKIKQRIDYKILSLTYKVHTTTQPSYLQGGPKKLDHFLKCITFWYNDIGRRSIYQNVQLFITSKTGILHAVMFKYSLHRVSKTILHWKYQLI